MSIERAIHKVQLQARHYFEVEMPEKFTPLKLEMQNGIPCMWYAVELGGSTQNRRVICVGTGEVFPDYELIYLGSVQDGEYVWHFLMIEEPRNSRSIIEAHQPSMDPH